MFMVAAKFMETKERESKDSKKLRTLASGSTLN
jgi:hypothetical protein